MASTFDNSGPWMGTTEAYRILGVKRYELFRMINRGDLPAYKISRWIRLRRVDVEQAARRYGRPS